MREKTKDGYFVYIVRCADGTYYTGWTTNLSRRMAAPQWRCEWSEIYQITQPRDACIRGEGADKELSYEKGVRHKAIEQAGERVTNRVEKLE